MSGSIVPFTNWFDQQEYEVRPRPTCSDGLLHLTDAVWLEQNGRIAFLRAMALSSIAPLFGLYQIHSTWEMYASISPIVPSLASYVIGLIFYATHIPECVVAPRWPWVCDWLD